MIQPVPNLKNVAFQPAVTPTGGASVVQPQTDSVVLSGVQTQSINKFEQAYRIGNDAVVQLALGDGPAIASMVANTVALPPSVAPFLGVINAVNAATGYLGIAADLRVNYDAMKNPNATKTDKVVDWVHLAVGDVINTGASMVPLFVPLTHPAAYAAFMIGQGVGMVFDAAKLGYDISRKGQQSALPDAHSPKRLVLDGVEKAFTKYSQIGGALALQSLALPSAALAIPAIIALPLMTIGGSFGFVGAVNQIKKGRELQHIYEDQAKAGATNVQFPIQTRHGVEMKEVPVDQAIKSARSVVRWGVAQGVSSSLMMAAGITGLAPVAAVAMAAGIGIATVAIGKALYDKRDELKSLAHTVVNKVEGGVKHLFHVGNTATPSPS